MGRTPLAFAPALALALLLPGCSLIQEPQVRELSGPTDGYTPTATYLKVHLRRDDGSVAMLDFDRRDWHTSEIAKRVDRKQLDFLAAQAMPREILSEYVVQEVVTPDDLHMLRYDDMGATPEQRMEMDREYDALLQRRLAQAAPAEAETPDALLPGPALP